MIISLVGGHTPSLRKQRLSYTNTRKRSVCKKLSCTSGYTKKVRNDYTYNEKGTHSQLFGMGELVHKKGTRLGRQDSLLCKRVPNRLGVEHSPVQLTAIMQRSRTHPSGRETARGYRGRREIFRQHTRTRATPRGWNSRGAPACFHNRTRAAALFA